MITQTRDILRAHRIAYTELRQDQRDAHMEAWFDAFIPEHLRQEAYNSYCLSTEDVTGYLWHAFSYELLDCLWEEDARRALGGVKRNNVILLSNWENSAFSIRDGKPLTDAVLEEMTDVILTCRDFRWTYAKTHESSIGPFFYSQQGR